MSNGPLSRNAANNRLDSLKPVWSTSREEIALEIHLPMRHPQKNTAEPHFLISR